MIINLRFERIKRAFQANRRIPLAETISNQARAVGLSTNEITERLKFTQHLLRELLTDAYDLDAAQQRGAEVELINEINLIYYSLDKTIARLEKINKPFAAKVSKF